MASSGAAGSCTVLTACVDVMDASLTGLASELKGSAMLPTSSRLCETAWEV